MAKKDIGVALGIENDGRIQANVDVLFRSLGCELKKHNRSRYFVPLDVLSDRLYSMFRERINNSGVSLPERRPA